MAATIIPIDESGAAVHGTPGAVAHQEVLMDKPKPKSLEDRVSVLEQRLDKLERETGPQLDRIEKATRANLDEVMRLRGLLDPPDPPGPQRPHLRPVK